MDVEKEYDLSLKEIKKYVRDSFEYFSDNYKRYHEFRKFVFQSTLTETDKSVLSSLNKPVLEVNIEEAHINRLCGEFSANEPGITVMSDDGVNVNSQVISTVENHIRHILFEAQSSGLTYETFQENLSGGFSNLKVLTEYANPKSFQQVIKIDKSVDPTLVGYDPLAKLRDKSDGRFYFEMQPISKDEFKRDHPDIDLDSITYDREIEGFSWAYRNNNEDILMVCHFFWKKKIKQRIYQIADGSVKTDKEYKKFIEKWEEEGNIAVPPAKVGKGRMSEVEVICRYELIKNRILSYVETDYPCFNSIFVDGNSVFLKQDNSGTMCQFSKPYLYNCKGIQKLKNCAAQNLANELEMMVQHKLMIAKESIPDEQAYVDAITDIQKANTYVYNAFLDNDPNKPVPPPQPVVRAPIPQEIMQTFTVCDQSMQNILGSYDASLGINDNQLSGEAIVQGALNSNPATKPYITGYMKALTSVANLIVKLIPLYYKTPRTIPIVYKDGSRGFQRINDPKDPQSIDLNYDGNALQVKVEAGASFAVQKNRALQQIIAMSKASPIFAQFVNAKGLKIILDNFEVRGIEQLKEMADQFMQELAQQQQQQMQMQQQAMANNPQMIKAQNEQVKLQNEAHQSEQENQIKAAELALQRQQIDNDTLKILNEAHDSKNQFAASLAKADAEKTRAQVDMAIAALDMKHKHELEKAQFHHEVYKTEKEHELASNKLSKEKDNSNENTN